MVVADIEVGKRNKIACLVVDSSPKSGVISAVLDRQISDRNGTGQVLNVEHAVKVVTVKDRLTGTGTSDRQFAGPDYS